MTAAPARPDPWTDPNVGPVPPAPVEALSYVRTDSRRPSLLALVRRPSRTAQLEGLLNRHRWANAGLRERLAELTRQHEQTLDAIAVIVDEEARVIGHAHPVIVRVRAQLDAATQERPA